MFFNKSKEELKRLMEIQIDNQWSGAYTNTMYIDQSFNGNIKMEIQAMIQAHAKYHTKQAIVSLIDHIYTNDDFEKDVGLKNS